MKTLASEFGFLEEIGSSPLVISGLIFGYNISDFAEKGPSQEDDRYSTLQEVFFRCAHIQLIQTSMLETSNR